MGRLGGRWRQSIPSRSLVLTAHCAGQGRSQGGEEGWQWRCFQIPGETASLCLWAWVCASRGTDEIHEQLWPGGGLGMRVSAWKWKWKWSHLQHFLSSLSTEGKSRVVFCLPLFPGQACLKADGMKSRSLQSYTWWQSTSAEGSVSPRPVSWLNVCSSASPPFPNTDQGCLWPFIFPSRNNCFLQCFCNTLKKFTECWEVQNRRQKSPQIPSFRENVFSILGHICIVFFFSIS